jgi:hypothetical protein
MKRWFGSVIVFYDAKLVKQIVVVRCRVAKAEPLVSRDILLFLYVVQCPYNGFQYHGLLLVCSSFAGGPAVLRDVNGN